MLVIVAELLHGTFRATSAEDTALAGQGESAEWPPSPARVFAALVAADGTGDRRRVTDGTELALLEGATPPEIYADPDTEVLRSELHDRFVVLNKTDGRGAVQEYVARQAGTVRPGTRCCPRTPVITYVWPDLDPEPRERAALEARAARVGYLGCADSPVRLAVSTDVRIPLGESWRPDGRGRTAIPVPFPGLLEVLDDSYARFSAGENVRRSWFATRSAWYRSPSDASPGERVAPEAIWLRFAAPISGRHVRFVTETLRATLLERYEPVEGDGSMDDPNGVPRVLHGHGFETRGFATACYLALPDVGYAHSSGRIHGAAVALPAGAPSALIEGVRSAFSGVDVLERPGVFRVAVSLHGGEPRPIAASPTRWQRASRHWVSAFPVVHERFRRRGPTLDDVNDWCRHAGLPDVVAFRTSRVPLVPGAVALHAHEVHRDDGTRHPFSHLRVAFDEPVRGPIALGRGRQFGLGLMVPDAAPVGT